MRAWSIVWKVGRWLEVKAASQLFTIEGKTPHRPRITNWVINVPTTDIVGEFEYTYTSHTS